MEPETDTDIETTPKETSAKNLMPKLQVMEKINTLMPSKAVASVGIFILLSLIVTVFLYAQNQKLKGLLATCQPQESQEATPTPGPMDNWLTYSASNSFSVMYPPDAKQEDYETSSTKLTQITFIGPDQVASAESELTDGYQISITATPLKERIDLQEVANESRTDLIKSYEGCTVTSTEQTTVDNEPATQFRATNCFGNSINKFVNHGGYYYQITGTYTNNSYVDRVLEILSTFRFKLDTPAPTPTACTLDAKECPDGSFVGRSGPNCEFTSCPTASPTP